MFINVPVRNFLLSSLSYIALLNSIHIVYTQCVYHNLMTEMLTNKQTRCISHRATSAGVNLSRPSAIALYQPHGRRFQPNIITQHIEIARARYFIFVSQFEYKTFPLAFIKQLIGLNIYVLLCMIFGVANSNCHAQN